MRSLCLRATALAVIVWAASAAAPARAGCGAECSCPLENPDSHLESTLLFDVSHLYIDQNQPRVGADDAFVGAIQGHHDEVRTVNRVTNFRVTYRAKPGWALVANLPWVHRSHEHIHHHMGEDHYQRWNDDGLGDLELTATRIVARSSGPGFRLGVGVKAPTGDQKAPLSEDGDPIEPSARLGTGAWGILASVGAEWRVRAPGRTEGVTMPIRATLAGKYNGRGVEDFRHGAEALIHLGAEYPTLRHLSFLLQTNYRVRAKDDVADTDEEESNTGGASVYVTPGLRYDALPGFSIYGLAQFPVWERVNGIQVVAESNLVLGISRSLF